MNETGRAGYTGSPGEPTCNTSGCHSSFALNSGDGSVTATSNMDNWIYEPLVNYTINIKVAKPFVNLFGFGAEILTSTNDNAGTIVINDAVRTQIKSRIVNGVIRKNIVHQLNGGASPDSVLFSFNWTAPDTSAGEIIMYFVGNAANANNSSSGDFIYAGKQLIIPSGRNGVDNLISSNSFSVYPNPASTHISLHYFLPKKEIVRVKLYDVKNSLSYLLMNAQHSAGENNEVISIPSECQSGLYLLSIESNTVRLNRKLMIN